AVRGFCPRGFPHSEISGSMPACGSPKLIAACHVFHRLLLPRHPPCALSSLTIKLTRPTAAPFINHLHPVTPNSKYRVQEDLLSRARSIELKKTCHPERSIVRSAMRSRGTSCLLLI